MIHFLRDNNNKTIVETECWKDSDDDGTRWFTEVSSVVNLPLYSMHLLTLPDEKRQLRFVSIIHSLDELRGWLWESHYMNKKNDGEDIDDVQKKIAEFYENAATILNLNYVVD